MQSMELASALTGPVPGRGLQPGGRLASPEGTPDVFGAMLGETLSSVQGAAAGPVPAPDGGTADAAADSPSTDEAGQGSGNASFAGHDPAGAFASTAANFVMLSGAAAVPAGVPAGVQTAAGGQASVPMGDAAGAAVPATGLQLPVPADVTAAYGPATASGLDARAMIPAGTAHTPPAQTSPVQSPIAPTGPTPAPVPQPSSTPIPAGTTPVSVPQPDAMPAVQTVGTAGLPGVTAVRPLLAGQNQTAPAAGNGSAATGTIETPANVPATAATAVTTPGAGTGQPVGRSATVPAPQAPGATATPSSGADALPAAAPGKVSRPDAARAGTVTGSTSMDPLAVAGSVAGTPASASQPTSTAAAPQPAPPSPPATALQPQLARPLFTLAAAAPGEHVMTLQVTPDDLGPMTVRAHIDAAGVRIELFAPGDAGREAIRGVLPELRKELVDAGFGASLDLSERNGPGNGARDGTGQDPAGRDGTGRGPGSGPGSGPDNRNSADGYGPGYRWGAPTDSDELQAARTLNGAHTTLDILA